VGSRARPWLVWHQLPPRQLGITCGSGPLRGESEQGGLPRTTLRWANLRGVSLPPIPACVSGGQVGSSTARHSSWAAEERHRAGTRTSCPRCAWCLRPRLTRRRKRSRSAASGPKNGQTGRTRLPNQLIFLEKSRGRRVLFWPCRACAGHRFTDDSKSHVIKDLLAFTNGI
jgi:hypothetical protein